MNNNSTLSFALYGLICLGIGIWEAQLLGSYGKPDDNICNELYGFGISKSVLNILFGIGYLVSSCIYYFKDSNDDKQSNNYLTLINTGVSIWGLVIVFNYLNDFDDCDYYKIIPIVEMYFFFICLALLLLVMLFSCCLICCNNDEGTNKSTNNNINKSDNNTNISVDMLIVV